MDNKYLTMADLPINTNSFKKQLQSLFKVKIQSLKRGKDYFNYLIKLNNVIYKLNVVKSEYYYHVYID